jgi:hypothetical protein
MHMQALQWAAVLSKTGKFSPQEASKTLQRPTEAQRLPHVAAARDGSPLQVCAAAEKTSFTG